MRTKWAFFSASIILTSGFCLAVTVLPQNAVAATLYVGGAGPGNYTLIQDAIDAAFPWDTVYVYSGTYFEHLTITTSIYVIGEDKNTTIIDGFGTSTVVSIASASVSFTGFTARNSGTGGGNRGISLSMAQNCFIDGNIVNNTNSGIALWTSHYNTVSNNTVQNSEDGIFLSQSDHNTIIYNDVSSITMLGINVGGSSFNVVSRNHASSDWEALSIASSDNNTVSNNTAVDSHVGLNIVSSYDNIAINNTFAGNEYGIQIWYEYNNTIAFNTISESSESGIYPYKTSRNTIENNAVLDNRLGIYLYHSDNMTIRNNNVSLSTEEGIYLTSSNDSVITGNTITLNGAVGCHILLSFNNRIYHNNIVDNANFEATDYAGLNTWDNGYPSGGNYWGDYTGDDEKSGPNQDQPGHDGIGDTTYYVPPQGTDRYPLMNPYGVPPPYPPYKPRFLEATAGEEQVRLNWSAPVFDGGSPITNYRIYRGTSTSDIVFLLEIGDLLNYTDMAVMAGQRYFYKVSAKNVVGEGALSDWDDATPEEPPNESPSCNITHPPEGGTVSGKCIIEGTASDPDGAVTNVDIRIGDSIWRLAAGTESWTFEWDTTSYENGEYLIQVRAWDGRDFSTISSVAVTVDNHDDSILGWGWTPIPLLISLIIVVVIVVALLVRKRRKMREHALGPQLEETEQLPPPPEVLGEDLPPPPLDIEEDIPPPPEELL